MVKANSLPVVHVVTRLAGDRESGRAVIDDPGLVVASVATVALDAEADVHPHRRAGVTRVARKGHVGADEREAIPMVLDGARVFAPSRYRMATFTLRAELAFVQICMAVRAARANIGKDFRDMARITRHVLVHAAKLKVSCRVVIKLEPGTQRRPTCRGVAVLTGDRELAVGARAVNLS